MKRSCLAWGCCALLVFGQAAFGQVGFQNAGVPVTRIVIVNVGPEAASESLVRANIRTREGEAFNRGTVDDDIRNLYATGYYFNIRVGEAVDGDPLNPKGVVLTYNLMGKPHLTAIRFEGNHKFSTEKLQKKISTKIGDPLDERKLFADVRTIKEMYQKAGLYKTEVRYLPPVIDENAGRGQVTFEILETPKVRVVDVLFDNATAFSQRKLRKSIDTRRWWMFSWITGSGKLKDDQLDDDREKLGALYRDAGYIDFELKEIKYDYTTTNRLKLHFDLKEGKQYKVGHIGFKGVTLFPTNELAKPLTMPVGAIFTPSGLQKDTEIVQDYFGGRGYIDTRVVPRKYPNIETGTMDLVFEVVEAEKVAVDRIEIRGNTKTKDQVIRRELTVIPGDTYDTVSAKRSRIRLEQLNFFERVDTRPEDTEVPTQKNLIVAVDEKNTGAITLGAGFSTVDSLVGFVEVSEGNFDIGKWKPPLFQGGGQKLRMRIAVGIERQDYVIQFTEPWLFDRKLRFDAQLYYHEYDFVSDIYEETRAGGQMSLTRALGSDFLIGSMGYTLEQVGILNVESGSPATVLSSEGRWLVNRLGGSIAYDTRNYLELVKIPNKGQRSEMAAEFGLGDSISFFKWDAKTAWYFPGLAKGHFIEIIGKCGVIRDLGMGIDNNAKLSPDYQPGGSASQYGNDPLYHPSENLVPFWERYYLGGPNSLRGYKFRDVAPQQAGTQVGAQPIGGNTYYMMSAEYSIPIIDRFRIAAFYDQGMVWYDSYEFSSKFSSDFGFGARLDLPIGPLRLDYAWPLADAFDQKHGGRFWLSVGYTREF